MPYIGIDFGTSNCVVATFRDGRAEVVPNRLGSKWTPSVVTLRRDRTLAFGQEARDTFDEQRSIRSVKRVLGTAERLPFAGQALRPEQIAVMLFGLLKREAEERLGESFTKAVVTIPANSKGLARHSTKLCAGAAGLQVLTLINEPTAAAIAYGINAMEDQTLLVYDFGGGTLDVTVLKIHHGVFEEIASKGIGRLGGDDIDQLLAQHLAARFVKKTGFDVLHSPHRQAFQAAVEQAKIDLSSEPVVVARRPNLVPERQLDLEEEIERGEFERLIMPLIMRSGEAIDEALALRGLRPGDIDRVLLVGGTSKIPLVRRYVSEKLAGKEPEPFHRADPMTCVAQGAAIVSAILQGAPGLDDYAYSVKLEHSLCTNPVNEQRQIYLDPLIKRGSDIPCRFTKTYHPVADPAKRVVISVYEGDVLDQPGSPDNVKLAEIPWDFDPPRPQRDAALEVTFQYGDDGILTVEIEDPFAQVRKRFPIEQAGPDPIDAAGVDQLRQQSADAVRRTAEFEATPEYREALALLQKAEEYVLPKIEGEGERQAVEEQCQAVRQAMATGDRAQIATAGNNLNDRLLNHAHLL